MITSWGDAQTCKCESMILAVVDMLAVEEALRRTDVELTADDDDDEMKRFEEEINGVKLILIIVIVLSSILQVWFHHQV